MSDTSYGRRLAYNRAWRKAKRAKELALRRAAELERLRLDTLPPGPEPLEPEADVEAEVEAEVHIGDDGPPAFDDDGQADGAAQLDDSDNSDVANPAFDSDDDFAFDSEDDHFPVLDDDEDRERVDPFQLRLARWATSNSITHTALDALLVLLRGSDFVDIMCLPRTARTLLGTPRATPNDPDEDPNLMFLDVAKAIKDNFLLYPAEVRRQTETIPIAMNVDGMPMNKSTKKQLWPVLCSIELDPPVVFPLTLTQGGTKPKDLDFLERTVDSLNEVLQAGLVIGDRTLAVRVKYIVCDAPARATVKCVKYFNGYYGCDRCDQKGEYTRLDGKTRGRQTYQMTTGLHLRTDAGFRARIQPQYHTGPIPSPFLRLPHVDMVRDFPVDYMHQLCLGVMRKLLMRWFRGPRRNPVVCNGASDRVDARSMHIKDTVPCEFARKPRTMLELEHWKATEFRLFLLYTGVYILQGVVDDSGYKLFLSLSMAARILLSPELVSTGTGVTYAKTLLTFFVEEARRLYGETFLAYNVHAMLHLPEDAERFGSLDACGGFQFENFLFTIKRMVRSGYLPLTQISNRMQEIARCQPTLRPKTERFITSKKPDNAYFVDGTKCVVVTGRVLDGQGNATHHWRCRHFAIRTHVYAEPRDSMLVGVFRLPIPPRRRKPASEPLVVARERFTHKAMLFQDPEGWIFQRVLHHL